VRGGCGLFFFFFFFFLLGGGFGFFGFFFFFFFFFFLMSSSVSVRARGTRDAALPGLPGMCRQEVHSAVKEATGF